ncbi:hypothetical protein SAMN04489732_110276 [Amycolatopsis saalfeldensis]|uniref:Uncharacterized protein n=2 Tax=Amycolatopsis saalfeldensis TaxID=394193 RepID=A0A1H8Y378_9PSEU|nr:hypothetical protein SAMN04489732_110276 [Amycolatopsis saalfeldensis]
MTYQPERELNLTYDPQRGWFDFVLYSETPKLWGAALNATQQLRDSSRYTQEWIGRLQDTEPTPLHMALVSNDDAPRLWSSCVFDDPESQSAVAGDGCLCLTTFYDPLTWMPVVKQHYRTVTGNIETWTYWTFSPLSLPEGQVLERLIIDQDAGVMWLRNDRGELYFLPEKTGAGYSVGYGGGGPGKFAAMIEKIVASDGHDVTPDTSQVTANRHLTDWTSSPVSDRTRELSLAQLRTLRATGTAPA